MAAAVPVQASQWLFVLPTRPSVGMRPPLPSPLRADGESNTKARVGWCCVCVFLMPSHILFATELSSLWSGSFLFFPSPFLLSPLVLTGNRSATVCVSALSADRELENRRRRVKFYLLYLLSSVGGSKPVVTVVVRYYVRVLRSRRAPSFIFLFQLVPLRLRKFPASRLLVSMPLCHCATFPFNS